jgi:predicted nucleic acid-binding protein
MANSLLIDTDMLVDYLRAKEDAIVFLESLNQPMMISAVSVAELFAGVKEGKERAVIEEFFEAFEIVPLTFEIARTGGLFRRDFGKSHGVGLADAMIAATSEHKGASLISLNQKHFPMVKNLIIPYKKES